MMLPSIAVHPNTNLVSCLQGSFDSGARFEVTCRLRFFDVVLSSHFSSSVVLR